MTSHKTRQPKPGYIPHDHVTDWQECDTCQIRTGAGITTDYDAVYYAQADPSRCPRCADGLMCLPATIDCRI